MLQRQPAPEFPPANWLNTERPLRLAALRGHVVLLDFWDYDNPNALRALPTTVRWAERYAAHGLTVIGVHTPAYAFGREQTQVELALRELDLSYPVLLDNEYRLWNAYGVEFWPTRYLIDQDGLLRTRSIGAGADTEFERAIQAALREIDRDADLPSVPADEPLSPEFLRPTPDLPGGTADGALGNPEGYAGSATMLYTLPERRAEGAFYAGGAWQASREFLSYRGTTEGLIQLPYSAAEVNAVLSPHPDAVERMLHPEPVAVEIWQDDLPLLEARRGADVTEDGRLLITRPRLYNLIRNPGFERHELSLRVKTRGFTIYAFSFVGGVRRKMT